MVDSDFVANAVAKARQVAAKLNNSASGGGGSGSDYNSLSSSSMLSNNGGGPNSSSSASTSSSMLGQKRPAPDSYSSHQAVPDKKPVQEKLSAASEAAARINQKLGGTSGFGKNLLQTGPITFDYKIPDKFVGLVIGKKGEMLNSLQSESGCKIVVSQIGGKVDREIQFFGTQPQIDKAKAGVDALIEKAGGSSGGGSGGGQSGPGGGVSGGQTSIDVMIPGSKAGLVIGKNGENIKYLQEECKCKMAIIQDSNQPTVVEKPLRITGDPEAVEKAKNMVIQFLHNSNAPGGGGPGNMSGGGGPAAAFHQMSGGGGGGGPMGGNHHQSGDLCVYAVPNQKAGLVIGKSGETVKDINARSGAFVQISKDQTSEDPNVKLFNIRGQRNQIDAALRLISERAGIPLTSPVAYYAEGQSVNLMEQHYQQQQHQQYDSSQQWAASGDYSQHWAGYGNNSGGGGDGSHGGHGGAGDSWSSQHQGGPAGGESGASGGAAGMPAPVINPATGQPDYSAAWAEYYRRNNMHEQAEMCLRQAKQIQEASESAGRGSGSSGSAANESANKNNESHASDHQSSSSSAAGGGGSAGSSQHYNRGGGGSQSTSGSSNSQSHHGAGHHYYRDRSGENDSYGGGERGRTAGDSSGNGGRDQQRDREDNYEQGGGGGWQHHHYQQHHHGGGGGRDSSNRLGGEGSSGHYGSR